MKKLFAMFLFCCAGILLPAQQNLFNKVYDKDSLHNYFAAFEILPNNQYFISGQILLNNNTSAGDCASYFALIDSNGNSLKQKTYNVKKTL